jgi:CheY-like chemotaxis protein
VLVPDTLPVVAVSRTLLRQALVSGLLHVSHAAAGGQVLIAGADTARGPALRLAAPVGAGAALAEGVAPLLEVSRRLLETQGGWVEDAVEGGEYVVTLTLPSVRLRKVLVVDDNPDVVMLFQRYLRGQPYRVVQAVSAGEALRLAAELRPDAITLDVMLPSQDGWEILAQLRSQAETRDTPVVVCSVLPEREVALSLGAEFVAKPVTRAALLQALDRALAARAAPRARP